MDEQGNSDARLGLHERVARLEGAFEQRLISDHRIHATLEGEHRRVADDLLAVQTAIAAIEARAQEAYRAQLQDRESLDKRLEGMNEFRAQMKDDAANFLRREEYDSRHESIANDLGRMERSSRDFATREEMTALQRLIWLGLGGVVVLGSLIQVLLFVSGLDGGAWRHVPPPPPAISAGH